jgi:hypothetical protein
LYSPRIKEEIVGDDRSLAGVEREGDQGDSMAKHLAESFWDRRRIRGKGPHNGHVKALSPLRMNRLLPGTW